MNKILEFINFSKIFRSHWTFRSILAVKEINLSVHEGELFGFIGHNGAGKTTTIKTVAGLIHKSKGEILYQGKPINDNSRQGLGYLPELPYFYDHLTVHETITFFANLYGINKSEIKKKVTTIIEEVGLASRANQSVRSLSKGLQQRLGLAQAIINHPKLLLLDEPFSGLDPIGRAEVRNLILKLNEAGTTIFMSSHILSDVEDMCNRVAIMSKGELKTVFSLKDITKIYGENYELQVAISDNNILNKISNIATSKNIREAKHNPHINFLFSNYDLAQKAIKLAADNNIKIISFKNRHPSLEDIFISTTQGKIENINSSNHKSLENKLNTFSSSEVSL